MTTARPLFRRSTDTPVYDKSVTPKAPGAPTWRNIQKLNRCLSQLG